MTEQSERDHYMCELMGVVESLSRRSMLKGAAVAGAAAGATAFGGTVASASEGPRRAPAHGWGDAWRYRTRLTLLGTAGGPVWWPGSDRAGISSLVTVGDASYLIDCGDGWGRRYEQAGFNADAPPNDLHHLRGVFLTHLHSDHVVDYPALLLFGFPGGGLGSPERAVHVFGPGRRGRLPAVYPPGRDVPDPVSPDNPWPGTEDMTSLLLRAFATDINDRIRDGAAPAIRPRVTAHDIALPDGAAADPNHHPAPRLDAPIDVYEDDRVKVTGTLVDHGQVFPSFAYRFDTEDGSVTFSGDTTVCDNLTALASGTDILVHEVVDPQWVAELLASAPLPPDVKAAYKQHLLGAHTTIEQVGPVAQKAGAKALVLSHYGPSNNPRHRWLPARKGFTGRFVIGDDLMRFGVGRPTRGRPHTTG